MLNHTKHAYYPTKITPDEIEAFRTDSLAAFVRRAMAASSGTCGDNITWSLDDAGVLTLTGTGNMTDYAYSGRSPWSETVKSVNIADGITSIDAYAFYHCADLTEITIPKSATVINKYSFEACTSLAVITIGEGVTSIAQSAFDECTALTSVTLPKVLKSIGNYAFDECSALTKVESLATVPPTLGTKVFANFDIAACTLLVPGGYTDTYRAADQWKDFGTITTGVNDIAADNTDFSVDVINGEIIVSGAPADALMSVYSISGARLYHGIIKPQSVPAPGIYIIRIASRALKLSVK